MAISSVLVGSLRQGGGLDWQVEVFPRRLLKWNVSPTVESFTVPGDRAFIAFSVIYVFSGGHPQSNLMLYTGSPADGQPTVKATVGTPVPGTYRTGLIGVQPEVDDRTIKSNPSPGYQAPDLSYQVSIWWAELPEVPEV